MRIFISLFILLSTHLHALGSGYEQDHLSIKKVGILIASQKGMAMSSFGHAFIRLSEKDDWSKDDTVIEFVADNQGKGFNSIADYLKGLGVGSSFKFKLNKSKYSLVKQNYNIYENRDLTTYPILTTPENIEKFRQILSKKSEKIDSETYAFFTSNCASQVSEILKESFDTSSSSSIPIFLSSRFSEIIDEKGVVTDYSASKQRMAILRTFLSPKNLPENNFKYQNLVRQLQSENYYDRIIGFSKMLELLSKNENPALLLFLNMFIRLESPEVYEELYGYVNKLNDRNNIQMIFLDKNLELLEIRDQGTVVANPNNSMLDIKRTILKVRYAINRNKGSQDTHATTRSINIDLKPYGFTENNGQIFYNNQLVMQNFESRIFLQNSHANNILMRNEVIKIDNKRYLLPVLIIENEGNIYSYNKADIKRFDLLPFANFSSQVTGKNFILSNCLSMVSLQKILLEQVIFVPDYPKISAEENEKLLKDALDGNVIFALGFSNIHDWINYIGQDKTKNILSRFSYDLNIAGYGNLIVEYFTRNQVTAQNIETIKSALNLGVTVPVRFAVDSTQEHALLLYDIADRGDYYALAVYDPNTSINKLTDVPDLYKLNKNDNLFYADLYVPNGAKLYIDKIDIESSIRYRRNSKRKDIQKFLDFAIREKKYSFSRDVFRF